MKNDKIQVLRTLAASLVILDHGLGILAGKGLFTHAIDNFRFNLGGIGVSMFFVISGFIMVQSTDGKRGSAGQALSFAQNRIVRIVPLYWIATGVAFALSFGHHRAVDLRPLLLSLGFIPFQAAGGGFEPILGPGWTLNYEMAFYALFAVSLLDRSRRGLYALFAVFAATVLAGQICIPNYGVTPPQNAVQFLAQPLILLFAIGMGLALIAARAPRLAALKHPYVLIAAILCAQVFAALAFHIENTKPFWLQGVWWLPSIAAVAVAIFASPRASGRIETISSHLGDASYCTYLFHLFVLSILEKTVPVHGWAMGAVFLAAAVALSNAVGFGLDKTVGQPLTRALKRILPKY